MSTADMAETIFAKIASENLQVIGTFAQIWCELDYIVVGRRWRGTTLELSFKNNEPVVEPKPIL